MIPAFKFRWYFLLALGLLPGLLMACGGSSSTASGGGITGVVWHLQNLKPDGSSTTISISQPASYTIEFQTGGTAHIKADCNVANFSYSISGNQLAIASGPSTLAYCGSDSHSDAFLNALQHATTYALQGDSLTINSGTNGSMNFKNA